MPSYFYYQRKPVYSTSDPLRGWEPKINHDTLPTEKSVNGKGRTISPYVTLSDDQALSMKELIAKYPPPAAERRTLFCDDAPVSYQETQEEAEAREAKERGDK